MTLSSSTFDTNRPDFFESIVENAKNGVAIYELIDGEPKLIYSNQKFLDITGHSAEKSLVELPLISNIKLKHFSQYELLKQSFKDGESFQKELMFIRKDESPIWIDIFFKPLKIKESSANYYLGILEEITERKILEKELKDSLEEVEQSKSVKDKFLANMSHEIRTPMTGVLGMAQLLLTTDINSEQKEYIGTIKSSTENLLLIINDILGYSEVIASDFKLKEESFNVKLQFSRLENLIKNEVERKGLEFDINISNNTPNNLKGDSGRLNQLLLYIVGNSIKFTEKGFVKLNVSTKEKQNSRVLINIDIRDSGIGISEDLLDTIFERFNQASKVTTYKHGGTGLGLSIVYQLVQRMGGDISVKSREGKGSTFSVTLPFEIAESDEVKSTEKKPIPENTLPEGLKLLVVDDHPINRKIVMGMMKKVGAEVIEADSGEDAIQKVKDYSFDLVLMDVHMPGIGGLEATRRLRKSEDKGTRSLPIIAVTASILQKDVEDCKQAGMDDFIAKPYTYSEMVEKISSLVQNKLEYKTTYSKLEEFETNKKVIDLSSLREMTGSDPDMIKEMIQIYLDKTPALFDQLTDELETGNIKEACKIAHTLKPTFSYVGVKPALDLSLKIEGYAEEPYGKEQLNKDVESLKKYIDQSINQLESFLQEM